MTDATEGEGDSLWSRLRRKVGQWGVAYAAGAWQVTQAWITEIDRSHQTARTWRSLGAVAHQDRHGEQQPATTSIYWKQ